MVGLNLFLIHSHLCMQEKSALEKKAATLRTVTAKTFCAVCSHLSWNQDILCDREWEIFGADFKLDGLFCRLYVACRP